jgi:DNA-binding NtrC family response regulator
MFGLNRKHNVLIVDDEKIIADSLSKIFSQQGHYETRIAYSAEDALDVINDWQPELAILDVVLPKMHGVELAVLLKAQYPTSKILLFSGQAITANFIEEAKDKGHIFPILAKPTHPTEMLKTAAQLLGIEEDSPDDDDSAGRDLILNPELA